MKDLPTTLRLVILAVLLLSLTIILRQFFVESADDQLSEDTANIEGTGVDKSAPLSLKVDLYPSVPVVLPDLNEGYLFNNDRKFENIDSDALNNGRGAVDLDQVFYAGSLVVGEIYRGLIVYQENTLAVVRSVSPRGVVSRSQRPTIKAGYKNKQLTVGERFMGYVVEKIEKDRIVFVRGDEMVEKFLYDQNKKRASGGPVIRAPSVGASVETDVRAVRQIPTQAAVSATAIVPHRSPPEVLNRSTIPPSGGEAPSAATLRSMRSESLLRLDPSLGMPPSLGVPGDPMRR